MLHSVTFLRRYNLVRLPTRRVTTMLSLPLATLEMRKKLEPKYNPQLFLGEVTGTKS